MKPRILLSLILMGSVTTCLPVHGAEQAGSDLSAALRVLWGLLAVIGIILILVTIAKKRMNFLHSSGNGVIKIIEVRHLMPKKSLYLVSVRGQEFLLASGGDRLELIAPVKNEDSPSFDELLKHSEEEEQS